jgi:hypothetical protein
MDNASRIPSERLAQEEADAAAAEAARIGGSTGEEPMNPAELPVREGGGGESEGFEDAEQELVENAGHGDGGAVPDSLTPERESDRSTAEYGEADEEVEPDE